MLNAILFAAAANGLLVVGDSLSSSECSWANQMDENGSAYLQVHAQGGRRWSLWEPSRDLHATGEVDTVIIWLGGNDVLGGLGNLSTIEANFMQNLMQSHVDALLAKEFRVVVIGLPDLSYIGVDTSQFEALIQGLTGVDYIPIDFVWSNLDLIDAVHPSCTGHGNIGFWMAVKLVGIGVL